MEPEPLSPASVQAAFAAIASLTGRRATERFNEFVREQKQQGRLSDAQHQELWQRVMLRPTVCSSKRSSDQPTMTCYCTGCVPQLGSIMMDSAYCGCNDSDESEAKLRLNCCYVYPSYEYQPHEDKELADFESKVHAYLVRMHKLPKPLAVDFYKKQLQILSDDLPYVPSIKCSGNLTHTVALSNIKRAAEMCDALFLVLCGHGRTGDGALLLSDGTAITEHDVVEQLKRARFTGTVFCVTNTCHTGPQPPPATGSTSWSDALPFRWVTLHSCDWNEPQKPSHAMHVAQMVARLLKERPAYTDLRDRADALWVETRPQDQKPALWRAPPQLSFSRFCTGRLLDGAP